MSLWYCTTHGLTGPKACCAEAGRVEGDNDPELLEIANECYDCRRELWFRQSVRKARADLAATIRPDFDPNMLYDDAPAVASHPERSASPQRGRALAAQDDRATPEGDVFVCPSCGGSHFGSGGEDFNEIECHDQFGVGCQWEGPRDVRCFPPNPAPSAAPRIDPRVADDIEHLVARAERYGLDPNRIARVRHHAAQLRAVTPPTGEQP